MDQTIPQGVGQVLTPSLLKRLQVWLNAERLEAAAVVITFVSMVTGLALSISNPSASIVSYVIAYIAGGIFGVQAGLASLRKWRIDVDLLMVLAALGAALVNAPFEGAMLLFLFSLSNVLQAFALGRTRNAIKSLMKLRPTQALTRRGSDTLLLPIEKLVVGDVLLVRPGERMPLDGIVVEGSSTVDESSLTGESMPVSKEIDSQVFAGTINNQGGLEIKVTRLAAESTISKLIKLVEEAQGAKAPTERFLDKFEQYYAIGVIVATLLMIVVPILIFREAFQSAFYRAMTLMVVASPCALIISTPASILSAIANGARKGVLFKGGAYLEEAANIKVVAFDKTGTLTVGKPAVTDVTLIPIYDFIAPAGEHIDAELAQHAASLRERLQTAPNENILLSLAAAVEAKSEHPLALAIVNTAKHRGLQIPEVTQFNAITGKGVRGRVAFMAGLDIAVGNPRYFQEINTLGLDAAMQEVERLQDEGKTSVIVGRIRPDPLKADQEQAIVLGVIAIADVIRSDAAAVIKELKTIGVKRVIMITGDNERVARAIATQIGVDGFYADLLPEDKVRIIKENLVYGPVAMVGDGVNDAPALATASLGMAMGAAGTDVALETADVVLMSDNLKNIAYAMGLSRQARRVVKQNLIFACAVIVVLVLSALGFSLPLPVGVIGHEGSTVLVCLNGLRLLAYRGIS